MLITCEKACEHFFIIDIFTLDTIPNRIKQIALFHINLYLICFASDKNFHLYIIINHIKTRYFKL